MMKDDDFKLLKGFADKRTDICDCRVAFATEKEVMKVVVRVMMKVVMRVVMMVVVNAVVDCENVGWYGGKVE